MCCTPLASGQTTFLELLGDTDGEQFGRALTTTGDLTGDGRGEILVGAPYADGGGDASGEVRLFSGHDGTLLLTNAGQAAEEFCGWALAAGDLDGDGLDELLLGSPGHAPGGRLRIIHGSDGSAFRSHVHSEADASYASSLAILEDLNGDGRPEYAVGAWGHDGAGTDAGLVEVYSGSDGALLFSVLGAAPGDELGYSLAGVADLSGDGIPDLILGARRSDGAGINAGSVRVVSGADGSDLYQLDGTAPGDAFGQSVTGLGDVDGDGLGDYAVGAHHGDTAGYNAGTVTIHSGGTGGILATIHGDTANQALGQTLARAGDLDGDGTQDLLAGAPSLDGTSYASGHASAYSGTTGLELFRLDGAQFLERLGQGLSPAGDIDLDGFPDFLVGAPGFSSSGVSAGTVLLISLHENVPPTAGADEFTIQEDTPATLAVLANDQDSDGTLDPASVTLIADPSHGSASVDSTTGLVSYTPALNYFGSDSFTYTVADNDGASSPETVVAITVQDVNDSPVAVDDSADTLEDTSVTISILANDSDVDGILRPESVEILTAPAHGSLSLDEVSGALTYQPGQDAEDTAVFTYRVADDDGDFTNAATVTVSITEINDAPVAISDGPVTDEDTPLAVDVLANDYDVDGSLIPASVQLHAHPTIGTASVDPLTGQITYTPKPEWSGSDSFSYSVADDDGERSAEALATLTVIDVNDIPVALGDAALLPPGQQSTIDVLLNDYDTDGSLVPGSVVISSPPQDGAASVDALTGAITYVPDVGFEGPDQLAYTVSDDDGDASLPGTLSLLVTSDCNGNGYPDGTDIANGTSQDCNGNGIPDECDLAGGNSQDCDGNGLADSCDANAYFVDATASCNGNGTAQAPFCAIQSAIDVAQNGMSVVVAPGVYTQALDMRGKRIHLVACQGPQVTIVDAGAAGVAILCQSGESEQTIIEGFTFTNGSSTWAGGGAYVSQ
ncbi:MAG: tandem-95 repeat protein, partial [Planctomycetota bacterium]|nr:tandem-95 repeat protein [Planctomycetota bacterium]